MVIAALGRRHIEAVIANVAYDPDNGQQAQVAIHVSKFNGVADGILTRPTIASKRLADHRRVRRIRAIASVEGASSNQRDSEGLEVSVRGHAKICDANPLLLWGQRGKTIHALRHLILRH